jgi:hypothetical protein
LLCVCKVIHLIVHRTNIPSYLLGGFKYGYQKIKNKLITQVNEEKV